MNEVAVTMDRARSVHGQPSNEGFVILGGPLGDGERRFLLIFNTDSAKTIETRLAPDPWTPMGS